jgi:hypothetical protein
VYPEQWLDITFIFTYQVSVFRQNYYAIFLAKQTEAKLSAKMIFCGYFINNMMINA